MDTFIFILEMIGTVAFASSGAMIAIEKKMDIFGVNVLGATTAVGGGIMRDVILGLAPPTAFSKPVYILIAVVTSTILFAIAYKRMDTIRSITKSEYYDKLMFWCDTAGLGIFTVVGIQTASRMMQENNTFFFVFIGVLTGVGGGAAPGSSPARCSQSRRCTTGRPPPARRGRSGRVRGRSCPRCRRQSCGAGCAGWRRPCR